jgi:hypothetical protein
MALLKKECSPPTMEARVRFPAGTCQSCVGIFSPAMGARNQVGIGLSYRPASLCSLGSQFQTRFLESIPRPIVGLKFSTLEFLV